MNPLSMLGIGLLLGIRHATDADHVVAVSAIVTQQKKLTSASIIGALWGIGHTITVFIVGVAIILFHLVIPPRVGLFLEFTVALALITLGILNLTGMLQIIIAKLTPTGHDHAHLHFHDADPHIHIHDHDKAAEKEESGMKVSIRRFIQQFGIFQLLRPIIIGLVHGLAGSAAVALLILSTITNPQVAVWYLLIFGLGTIIGMMLITTLIGVPIIAASKRFSGINRYITVASGLLSLLFGLYLAYEIGVTDQLFGVNPQWDPH
jgi:high-affinity nickel permease